MDKEQLKKQIFDKIKEYYELVHKNKIFVPGQDLVNYAGRVFDENEMIAAVDSILEFWLTVKDYDKKFSEEFSKYLGSIHLNFFFILISGFLSPTSNLIFPESFESNSRVKFINS